jgi:hypothetical protein
MARSSPNFSYRRGAAGKPYLEVRLRGHALLRPAATSRGTAFTADDRALGLEGMLPPQVCTLEDQVARL